MAEYIIKSTISITVLYILYYFLLRNTKSFLFNRFYLLFTTIFSLVIPLLQISVDINLVTNQNIQDYSSSISDINIQGAIVNGQKENVFSLTNIILVVYFNISSILLIRLIFNLWRIIKLINNSNKDLKTFPRIVLSHKKTLPYSFFQYIIVDKREYEERLIDNDLIIHEQAHCNQWHSIDILFIELVKIIFWFNPIIWILKKEIQLNHEYLADNKVLQTQNLKTYQGILLNLVFRNNSTYLASNFNYSLTKNRLIMMTKNDSSIKLMVRKIAVIPLVLLLTLAMSFGQQNISKDSLVNHENAWWYPILKKHDIELKAFNNFDNLFYVGTSNSIENSIVTITEAMFIMKRGKDKYCILKSDLAYHDMNKNRIWCDKGSCRTYSLDLNDDKLYGKFDTSFDIIVQDGDNYDTWIMDKNTGQIRAVK